VVQVCSGGGGTMRDAENGYPVVGTKIFLRKAFAADAEETLLPLHVVGRLKLVTPRLRLKLRLNASSVQ
jgi:hypothetical protein